jgi:Raf kinase inhibitor-like YbhB/YbcL family protein
MKKVSWANQVLYSAVFLSALGCAYSKPSAPVTRTNSTAPAPVSRNASPQADNDADGKTADSVTAPQTEDKAAPTPTPTPAASQPMTLTSTAFANNAAIPRVHVAAAGGGNMSPPLAWKNPPAGTGSFAIQMVDLDFLRPSPAPFIHWVITNIPATSTQLPAAVPSGNNLAAPAEALGASQFKNYGGPNPPNLHRYEWTIYAIKQGQTLNIVENSTMNKAELEAKSLGKATLIGTFTP